jgi:hypothetical protein
MFVLVSADGDHVRAAVQDQQNLRQLHAEFRRVGDADADQALRGAGLGTVAGDHVWLEPSALRAAGDGSADWNAQFDAMLRYAASNGWTDEESARVRAHIVRT